MDRCRPLGQDEFCELAAAAYGPLWQSALAREHGVAVRTVQRWTKNGIERPETAAAIRALLVSRRVVHFPLPPLDENDAQDEANAAMHVTMCDLIAAGMAAGWHPADLLCGVVSSVGDQLIDLAGAEQTIEIFEDAIAQMRKR